MAESRTQREKRTLSAEALSAEALSAEALSAEAQSAEALSADTLTRRPPPLFLSGIAGILFLGGLCCLCVLVARAAAQAPTAAPSVSMVGVSAEGAAFWPRWRGPSGQGLATDLAGQPARW